LKENRAQSREGKTLRLFDNVLQCIYASFQSVKAVESIERDDHFSVWFLSDDDVLLMKTVSRFNTYLLSNNRVNMVCETDLR